jgi:hypothetical protein
MPTLAQNSAIAKLPMSELNQSLREFVSPVTDLLPEVRLSAVAEVIVRGLVTRVIRSCSK